MSCTDTSSRLSSSRLRSSWVCLRLGANTSSNALNTVAYVWTNKLSLDGSIELLSGASPVNTQPTNIVSSVSGGNLTLQWPADHTGWRLQMQTNALSLGLGTNWVDVAGSAATNQVTLPVDPTNPAAFFRLVYP